MDISSTSLSLWLQKLNNNQVLQYCNKFKDNKSNISFTHKFVRTYFQQLSPCIYSHSNTHTYTHSHKCETHYPH